MRDVRGKDPEEKCEMTQKEEEEQEEQRGRVAPNMGAVGPRRERNARDEMG